MNPITAANAIAQERTVATATFPVTGDPELDAISGVLAVFEESKLRVTAAGKLRVLAFLTERVMEQAEKESRLGQLSGIGAGIPWNPQPGPPPPWGTTSGTDYDQLRGLQNQQPHNPFPQISPPASAP
jgi:hypothetical protein